MPRSRPDLLDQLMPWVVLRHNLSAGRPGRRSAQSGSVGLRRGHCRRPGPATTSLSSKTTLSAAHSQARSSKPLRGRRTSSIDRFHDPRPSAGQDGDAGAGPRGCTRHAQRVHLTAPRDRSLSPGPSEPPRAPARGAAPARTSRVARRRSPSWRSRPLIHPSAVVYAGALGDLLHSRRTRLSAGRLPSRRTRHCRGARACRRGC